MSASAERIDYLIVGIGVNVNEEAFAEEIADRATSLHIETGEKYSRKAVLHGILSNLEKYYLQYINSPDGFAAILDEYRSLCMTLGSRVTAEWRGGRVEGTAEDISESGGLVIRTDDAKTITVNSGEVSVRGLLGYV
jgi:BirA family biotin operon repressor/biotin-[acetyl-CoA-carboxylase] ligase